MYEIIKNGTDDYTLKYKDKEIRFHSDIENVKRLQSINEIAEEELVFKLAQKGMSINDLTIKKVKDGKTYYDSSNKQELLNTYKERAIVKIIDDICKLQLSIGLDDLLDEIGFTNSEETLKFAQNLSSAFAGKFPSKEDKKQK